MSAFLPGTPAADTLEWLREVAAAARPAAGAAGAADAAGGPGDAAGGPDDAPAGGQPGDAEGPFLTVLVRTQGTRPATLEDTLLTLAAQTCDDFEVLVLVHDPVDGTLAAVEETVGTFHPRFAGRVRVVAVEGGGRSRPLNVGARLARGRYVAMLDDDDLAFAHWVASFKAAAERARGAVVRCCVATQLVRALPGAWGGTDGYEVAGRPHVDYPLTFDHLDHLVDNRTPNNGYAVPRAAVWDLGLTWDESLPVLEDWDHLLRAASLLGVESAATVSALLRAWSEGSSSKTVHSEEVWKEAHRLVEERQTAAPVLFARGAAAALRARAARDDVAVREHARLRAEARHLRQVVDLLSGQLDEAGRRLEAVDEGVVALRHALEDAEAQLRAMRASTTWRLGRAAQTPLSLARRLADSLRDGRAGSGPVT